VRTLPALRRQRIAPHLAAQRAAGCCEPPRADLLRVQWPLARGLRLRLVAHLPADSSATTIDLGGEPGEPNHEIVPNPRRPAADGSARWSIVRGSPHHGEP
jgi:hypothetical protein